MSLQSGSLGRLWLGPQSARESAATTYYGFKANVVDLAPGQMYRGVGNLVGGSLLPGGQIKTAAWVEGGLVMPPPLDDQIGWLLYAFAGSVSSVSDVPVASTYQHVFPSGGLDSTAPQKYLTGRRSVPGTTTSLYEQFQDLKVARLQFNLAPGEFTSLRADFLGRVPSNPDGSGWSYSAKNEDSVPISCKGTFELPDGTPNEVSTAIVLDMVNIMPDMREVLVGGSYYPYDFPVLGRQITVQFQALWDEPTLYESLHYSGTAWSPIVYNSDFEVSVESASVITGSTPYSLLFYGGSIDWTCEPVALRGASLVQMRMTGTIADADSGPDWYLRLQNGTNGYAWPT